MFKKIKAWMFRYKISIYMKSGNVMYFRCRDCVIIKNDHGNKFDKITLVQPDVKDYLIDNNRVESVIAKKWWQRWG